MRLWLLCLLAVLPSAAQSRLEEARRNYEAADYDAVIRITETLEGCDPESSFLRGLALAKRQRWLDAEQTLLAGRKCAPHDQRFPTELAGVFYRLQRYAQARRSLRRALRLAPDDEYARNFLGTLYLLDDNLDAAISQWNHIGKPRLSAVELPSELRTEPVLIDRAFAFAPTETLLAGELNESRARLDLLGVFPTYRFDLAADTANDGYRLRLRGFERRGWGGSPLLTAARWLRGLPYQTVLPEVENWDGNASRASGLVRWDPNRRRVAFAFSRPLAGEARRRWFVFGDARDENWSQASFRDTPSPISDFHLRKGEIGGGFDDVVNGNFQWGAETAVSVRSYLLTPPNVSRAPDAVSARVGVNWRKVLLRVPGRRLTVENTGIAAVGRVFADDLALNRRIVSGISLEWEPRRQWQFQTGLTAGAIGGAAPFDELFHFGIERDNPLWFRGIRGARDGRKGASPAGDRYWLLSSNLTRKIPAPSFLNFSVGPFFDAGSIHDSRGEFGADGVQLAAGVRLDVQILGAFGVSIYYGRDLRRGRDLFFGNPLPAPRGLGAQSFGRR